MSNLMEMEVYNAAVKGDLTIFSIKNREQLLKKTYQNNNIIHVATQHKQLDFIKAALNNFPSIPTCESLISDQNRQGNTPLHIAAEVRDEVVMDRLYEFFSTQCGDAGASDRVLPWRVMNKDGNTPAHVALLHGNVWIAMYLVEKDDYIVRVLNRSKQTLLHLAIQYYDFDNYESQIPKTEATSASKKLYQPEEGMLPIIGMLLERESSVACWVDADGKTPLHRAASLKPAHVIQVIKAMLASCPEAAEVHDEWSGQTVLHLLTNYQVPSFEQGQELLKIPQVYAVRNSKDHQGDTPLHLAVRNRDAIMMPVLLASSPRLDLQNKNGISAATLFQRLVETKIRESLKERRRRMTKEDYKAAQVGDAIFLNERLASLGKEFLLSQTSNGGNILHILMKCDFCLTCVLTEAFIEQTVQTLPFLISQQDSNGNTPIHVFLENRASPFTFLELVSKYLGKARVETGDSRVGLHSLPWRLKNGKGETLLHVAVRTKNYDYAIKLLEMDEEVAGYVNNRNQTPLHLLAYCGDYYSFIEAKTLMKRLIIANADTPYMQDEDGLTPLLTAVQERTTFMIQKLHKKFRDSSVIADLKGRTLWHLFVSRRYERNVSSTEDFELMVETSKILIQQDTSDDIKTLISSKDNDGNTPLHLAIVNQQFDFAQFFLDNCWSIGRSNEEKYNELLSKENNDGVSSYNLIGSAEHFPREFEMTLFKNGNLLYGHRSLYGVPITKIDEYANTIGVIAALLATITFTAAFTVPGGLDSSNGTPLLLQKAVFQVFLVADVVAMCLSIMVLFCLLWIMTTGHKRESIFLLDVSVFLLQASFHATLVTFMTGLYVTTISTVPAIAISTCVTCTLLIILMHKRLVMWTVVPVCNTLTILDRVLGHFPTIWASIKK